MRVRAHALGFYGICLRNPGHIFHIKNESEFSESWMEWVDEAEAAKGRAPGKRGGKLGPVTAMDAKIARVDAMVLDEAERAEAEGKDVI
jgi:hypothetical protein